jgi:hypothetical protein
MTIQDSELLLKQLKLKMAINKYLCKWSRDYATQIFQIVHCIDIALYHDVVNEMEQEGMLTKERGKNGALILVYSEMQP